MRLLTQPACVAIFAEWGSEVLMLSWAISWWPAAIDCVAHWFMSYVMRLHGCSAVKWAMDWPGQHGKLSILLLQILYLLSSISPETGQRKRWKYSPIYRSSNHAKCTRWNTSIRTNVRCVVPSKIILGLSVLLFYIFYSPLSDRNLTPNWEILNWSVVRTAMDLSKYYWTRRRRNVTSLRHQYLRPMDLRGS